MKKMTFAVWLLFALCYRSLAQTPLPVTSGLTLHLDAASGFDDNGSSAAVWHDLSGNNNLTSGTGTAEPTFNTNIMGTGFPGVEFDGVDDYMQSGFPAALWSSTDNVREATLFVVRIATNTSTPLQSLLTVCDNAIWDKEFCLHNQWGAMHHTDGTNWSYRVDDPTCFSSLPNNRPVIYCASLGATVLNSDIELYRNDILSSQSVIMIGTPVSYTAVDRMICLGARYYLNNTTEFFNGAILEVLAYNRK